jgi:hypothetical protein
MMGVMYHSPHPAFFGIGILLGGAGLIVFNIIIQSPSVFLSFLLGMISSAILSTIFFAWFVINGYLSVCEQFGRMIVGLGRNHNFPKIVSNLINILNPMDPPKDPLQDFIRRVAVKREEPVKVRRRRRQGAPRPQMPCSKNNGFPKAENPRGTQGVQGPAPQGARGVQGLHGPQGVRGSKVDPNPHC